MTVCPKCNSEDTYRRSPHSLQIECERCKYKWDAKQPIKPYQQKSIYLKTTPAGKYHIRVWRSPKSTPDKLTYSFAFCFQNSLPYRFNEFEEAPILKGSYETPQMAVNACIDWIVAN